MCMAGKRGKRANPGVVPFWQSIGITTLCLIASAVSLRAGLFDDKTSSSPAQTTAHPKQSSTPTDPAPAAAPAARRSLPNDAAIKVAEKQVHEITGDKIAGAHTSADRVALSAELLGIAKDTSEPAGKFVLLRDAERLAVDAGDVEATIAAHTELSTTFDLGGSRLAVEAFQKLTRGTLSVGDAQKLCPAMLSAADDAVAGDHFDIARQIVKLAGLPARVLNDSATNGRLSSLLTTIGSAEAQQRKIAPAIATLASHPDDPAANAEVGRYRCFVKDDWAAGLSMLAKSNDDVLKALAARELASPASATDRVAVADGWWDYAQTQTDPVRSVARQHAGQWYAQAVDGLTGLTKLKAEKRAEEYLKGRRNDSIAAGRKTAARSSGSGTFTSAMEIVQSLPANLFPANLAAWDDDHQRTVNDVLELKVVGHDAMFALPVKKVTLSPQGGVYIDYGTEPVGPFTAKITTSIMADVGKQFASMQEGNTYTVAGRISLARFNGNRLDIGLYLSHVLTADERARAISKAGETGVGRPRPEYHSIDEVLTAIPLDIMPKGPDEWAIKSPKRDAFFRKDQENFDFKTITARVVLKKSPFPNGPQFQSQKFPIGSESLVLRLSFDPDNPALAKLKIGDTVNITGKVGGMGRSPSELSLSVNKCNVVPGG
jgi:hypothetical protein